jgi:hypothetical protein
MANKRTFNKFSIVKALMVHNTLEIPEGKLLVVSSCSSGRDMFTSFGVNARLSKKNFQVVCAPFKVGDVVTCIDPTGTLTKDKEYKTYLSSFSGEVCVVNDRGISIDVLRSRFAL